MGLNRPKQEDKFSDEAIAKRLGLPPVAASPASKFSDAEIARRLGLETPTEPTIPEFESGIPQIDKPVRDFFLRMSELEMAKERGRVAGFKKTIKEFDEFLLGAAAGAIPFIDEVPGLRGRFQEARKTAKGAFRVGEVIGTLGLGGGALAGAKVALKPIVKKALPAIAKSSTARRILGRAGIDVAEGAIADGLFNAVQGELPTAKDLAIFAAVDAALPGLGGLLRKIKPIKDKPIIAAFKLPDGRVVEGAAHGDIRANILEANDPKAIPGITIGGDFLSIKELDRVGGDIEKALKRAKETKKEVADIIPGAKKSPTLTGVEPKPTFETELTKARQISIKPDAPPKAPELSELTSIKNVSTDELRKELNLSTLSSPESVRLQGFFDEAIRTREFDNSLFKAQEIIKKPRSLSPVETAGFKIKLVGLKKTHKTQSEILKKAKDGSAEAHDAAVQLERINSEIDIITEAGRIGGREQAISFRLRQEFLDQSYDNATNQARARQAVNQKEKDAIVPKDVQKKIEELSNELEKRDIELEKFRKTQSKRTADALVKRGSKKFEKMTPQQKREAFNDSFEKAKKLIKEGCVIGG